MLRFLLAFLFVSIAGFGEEITANTVAVEPTTTELILQYILIGVGSLVGFAAKNGLPLIKSYLKEHMHFRGASVVNDAICQAAAEMAEETRKALADGKITDSEKKALKASAKAIAIEKLKRLAGFYKKDLASWVDEALSVSLGKLLLTGSSNSGLKTR